MSYLNPFEGGSGSGVSGYRLTRNAPGVFKVDHPRVRTGGWIFSTQRTLTPAQHDRVEREFERYLDGLGPDVGAATNANIRARFNDIVPRVNVPTSTMGTQTNFIDERPDRSDTMSGFSEGPRGDYTLWDDYLTPVQPSGNRIGFADFRSDRSSSPTESLSTWYGFHHEPSTVSNPTVMKQPTPRVHVSKGLARTEVMGGLHLAGQKPLYSEISSKLRPLNLGERPQMDRRQRIHYEHEAKPTRPFHALSAHPIKPPKKVPMQSGTVNYRVHALQ